MPENKCLRCGILWQINLSRKNHETCPSCRARKTNKIGQCLPWQGRYAADQITPIHDDGTPVMIGKRTCGNSDCCNPLHKERA